MRAIGRAILNFCQKADMFLLGTCLLATGYGMVLISSAGRALEGGAEPLLIKQAAACGLGVVLFIIFSLIDIQLYTHLWKWLIGFNIGFIALLFPFGEGEKGNPSWLRFSFLPFDIQPAEVVKVSFVILLAFHMYMLRDKLNQFWPMMSVVAHVGGMVGLILLASEDLGVAFIYVFAFVCMAVAAGVRFWWFLAAGLLGAGSIPIVWQLLSDRRRLRLLSFFSQDADPTGLGWQLRQSKIAFIRGDLWGLGLYNGPQTQSDIIPEQYNDFILSAAGEELGFLGSLLVLGLLLVIIFRVLWMATKANNGYGAMICAGMAGILIFQTFENIGMCIGLAPIIGVTLPFFSYGGTSLISMYAAMGIVSSIKMRPMPSWIRDRGR